jgi:hypothetical protein
VKSKFPNIGKAILKQAMRNRDRALGLCIVAFTALCGSVSLIYPFGRDQGSYGYAGWVVLEGGVPYRDVFVLKPPMTVFVHSLAMGIFGVNTWAIRVLDIGWTALTAFVVATIAVELWHRRDAALAAGLTYPFLYYQIDYWNIAQTDGWMALPCAAAIWAALRGRRALEHDWRRASVWWLGSGMLAGVAVLFKYTAGAIGAPMLVALYWAGSSHGRRAWFGVPAMLFGGLLTLAACWIWLVHADAWNAFLDSQLGLVAPYVGKRANADSVTQTLRQLVQLGRLKQDLVPLLWSGPAALVIAMIATWRGNRTGFWGISITLAWWIAAVIGVAAQGKFFDYHYLPLIAPASLITGLGAAALLAGSQSWIRGDELRTLALVALLALLVASTPLGGRMLDLGRVIVRAQTIEQYIKSRREYALPTYDVDEIRRVSKLLRETTTPDQRVLVWSFEATINVRARRHTVSRFLYNYPFRLSWRNPEYDSELMRALRSRPPDVVVIRSGDRFPGFTDSYEDSATLLRDFGELDAFIRNRYEAAERVGRYSFWRLRDPVTTGAP